MKRIIKVWEDIILYLICFGIYSFVVDYNVMNRDYSNVALQRNNNIKENILGLLGIFLIVMVLALREYIKKKRTSKITAELIYGSNSRTYRWRLLIIMLSFLICMVSIVTKFDIGIIVSYGMSFVIFLGSRDLEVYATEELMIINGTIYWYESISELEFGDLYNIYCVVEGEKRTISCFSGKRYTFLENYFEQKPITFLKKATED